ncbi:hypothetical protein Salat_1221500 [Sesamum alatum]|uniref:Uncharacterized protein n=1 Tax=Sesamum alatum TaxID=300844 RepID=A0AAE2CP11_9LAMI|nr:hypothetical protein Salat_1221500 [Sesamum alatum]
MALDLPANSDRFEPTDRLLRVSPVFLWYLHLNEPTCVVGEHKQLYLLTLADLLMPTGEVEAEEQDGAFNPSMHRLGMIGFGFSYFMLVFDSSAILVLLHSRNLLEA